MKPQLPPQTEMYQALVNRDSRYEGIFFVGVKTTGIFCRPTCKAKKPKQENVEYFTTTREALNHGFRPCKLCTPMELSGGTPEWMADLLDSMNNGPVSRLKDRDLKQRGIDPSRVRRWFLKNHGMTFHAYTRALRLNHAFGNIKNNAKVTDAAFDSGFDSLSGFSAAFRKATGFAPSTSRTNKLITCTRILTPLGPMLAGAADQGICLLEFTDRKMLETQVTRLERLFSAGFITGAHKHLELLEHQLQEYFNGKRRQFTLPLALSGTDFQLRAWEYLQDIPYGETRSYLEQALAAGNKNATRAVARANGDNRIAIIIPCHRVIGSDGKLTGYGGGLWRKRYLLDLERKFNL
jgi:AraC family transcriptional regulator of adaptative response/methylated-DNA-[protein]-cysteine methyltransferase